MVAKQPATGDAMRAERGACVNDGWSWLLQAGEQLAGHCAGHHGPPHPASCCLRGPKLMERGRIRPETCNFFISREVQRTASLAPTMLALWGSGCTWLALASPRQAAVQVRCALPPWRCGGMVGS